MVYTMPVLTCRWKRSYILPCWYRWQQMLLAAALISQCDHPGRKSTTLTIITPSCMNRGLLFHLVEDHRGKSSGSVISTSYRFAMWFDMEDRRRILSFACRPFRCYLTVSSKTILVQPPSCGTWINAAVASRSL